MQQFSFWVSLVLALLTLLALLSQIPIHLDVVLTKDVFLRILDRGDSIFLNVLFLARNGNAFVEDASVELRKTGSAEKRYQLSITHVGEKVRGTNVIADHSFYSSSPITFVSTTKPLRLVYVCNHSEYSQRCLEVHNEFMHWASDLADRFPAEERSQLQEDEIRELFHEIDLKTEEFVAKVMQSVQTEEGDYELSVTVTYQRPGFLRFWKRQVTSHVQFTLPPGIGTRIRSELQSRYKKIVYNLLGGQHQINFSEYTPTVVAEMLQ